MQVPLPGTYPVTKNFLKFSVTRCFMGHFKVESRVTSVAWADATPSKILEFYFSKPLL
jgi:hypothetical protein